MQAGVPHTEAAMALRKEEGDMLSAILCLDSMQESAAI